MKFRECGELLRGKSFFLRIKDEKLNTRKIIFNKTATACLRVT